MSAQRGNIHLAGDLRTGVQSPHFFEIWEKCEKPLQTPHLQSEAMSSVHRTECKKVQCHNFLNERFRQEPDIVQ